MPNYTEKYRLPKPGLDENYDILQYGETLDQLDQALGEKAGKVTGGTPGNLLALAADGSPADSGKKPADLEPALTTAAAITTLADTDTLPVVTGGVTRRITWAGVKALLKAITDAAYALKTHTHPDLVPTARKVAGKPLTGDVSLTAADVGARPASWMPTAADVGATPASHGANSAIHVTAGQKLYTLTHSKSGTVHTLAGLPAGVSRFTGKFDAAAPVEDGDSWKIGSTVYTAALASGEPLGGGVIAAGAIGVTVEVDTTGHKLGFKAGGGYPGTLPSNPSGLTAKGGNATITLTMDPYTAETAADLKELLVIIKAGSMPQNNRDGFVVRLTKAQCVSDTQITVPMA